mgnify:CR=1 FL=1
MSVPAPLTNPLDALLLPRVLRWVSVVFRQKSKCGHLDTADGRPWSRIPAKDLAAQLEREEGLEVSVRRIQRSLERLVEAGYLARCQRTKWWGQRDWWYSWSDAEWSLQQHRPTAVARSSSVSSQGVRNRRSEASAATVQVLGTPLNTQTSLKAERKTASQFDREGPCAASQGGSVGATGQRSQQRRQSTLQTLLRTVQRAEARGFASVANPGSNPDGTTEVKRWVQDGFVFVEQPNGLVTKDPVATAPMR